MMSRAARIWASNSGLWTVRRIGEEQFVTFGDVKPIQNFFWQDHANRIADLGEFEGVHALLLWLLLRS
jgi:hypothetical protein